MSSLLSTASPWTSDENTSKKRTSSIRKTMKRPPMQASSLGSISDFSSMENNYNEGQDNSLDEVRVVQEERTNRIDQLLNQMAATEIENAGNKMANFQPLSHPAIQKRTDMKSEGREEDPAIGAQHNPLQIPPPQIRMLPGQSNFLASATDLGNLANNPYSVSYGNNYAMAYRAPAPAGVGEAIMRAPIDNKLMEKINYMIHLLEQQHNEKTSNITEEFVLYTFLGVFIIFIVDSFARAGKYIR